MTTTLETYIEFLRRKLTLEYAKAGRVTPKVLSLSQTLDHLILNYTLKRYVHQNFNSLTNLH